MKWTIPGKTFLLGEYAAICGEAAVLLTTFPSFSLEKISEPILDGVHLESPAGQFWLRHAQGAYGLRFTDPFYGMGGLGASSAQFIAAWMAHQSSTLKPLILENLLDAYWRFAWDGKGLRPSGYDIKAQLSRKVVFLPNANASAQVMDWKFADLHFLLIHTGQKLATHRHLKEAKEESNYTDLHALARQGANAIQTSNASQLIEIINAARRTLQRRGLQCEHSVEIMESLLDLPSICAVKGCGALGADIIVALTKNPNLLEIKQQIELMGLTVVASERELYDGESFISKKSKK